MTDFVEMPLLPESDASDGGRFDYSVAGSVRRAFESAATRLENYVRIRRAQIDVEAGRRVEVDSGETFSTCPIPEIAGLGRTLRRWRQAFLAYFTTHRANNGGTEAINGIIELHRRLARGYRNRRNYRLRMLLAVGGLEQ